MKYSIPTEKILQVRKVYQNRIQVGLCPRCGKIPPEVDKSLCQKCLDDNRNRAKRLTSIGLCPQCGKNPSCAKTQLCQACRDKQRPIRAKQNRQHYAADRAAGLCVSCGQPAVLGKSRCQICAETGNAYALTKLRERYDYINALKIEKSCIDCGYNAHPAGLEFDHLPGTTKVDNVSALIAKSSWKKVLAEIEKCEVVCAICHAIRTWNRLRGIN